MFKLLKNKKNLPFTNTELTIEQREYALKKIDILKRQLLINQPNRRLYADEVKVLNDIENLKDKLVINSLTQEDLALLNKHLTQKPQLVIDLF